MLRSIVAVLAGYLIFVGPTVAFFHLSGRDPHAPASLGFLILSTLCGMFFAGVGGFVAAALSGRLAFEHAFAVASLIAVIGAASLLGSLGHSTPWTQLGAVLIMAPMAMAGGYLRRRQIHSSK